ncbi:MAG: monovalent cation/H(+) antiporter subunit G [Longimicrobiales bacterium]
MSVLVEGLSWVFLMAGVFFTLTGALGMLRMPDVFTRMHAAGMTDTMGAGFIALGLIFQAGVGFTAARLVLIVALLWFTSPIATHALAKAALHGNVEPYTKGGTGLEGGGSSKL